MDVSELKGDMDRQFEGVARQCEETRALIAAQGDKTRRLIREEEEKTRRHFDFVIEQIMKAES